MDYTSNLHIPGPRELLLRLNDPAQQRQSYPCIERWLEHIDLAATDLLHGWLDDSRSHECFDGPFADAFGLLILREGQHVLRRVARGRQGSGSPGWHWEHTGDIVEWVAIPAFTAPRAPQGHWSTEELVLALYPQEARRAFLDSSLYMHFPTAADALWWAQELLHNSAEYDIQVRVLFRAVEDPRGTGPLRYPATDTTAGTNEGAGDDTGAALPPLAAAITGGGAA